MSDAAPKKKASTKNVPHTIKSVQQIKAEKEAAPPGTRIRSFTLGARAARTPAEAKEHRAGAPRVPRRSAPVAAAAPSTVAAAEPVAVEEPLDVPELLE